MKLKVYDDIQIIGRTATKENSVLTFGDLQDIEKVSTILGYEYSSNIVEELVSNNDASVYKITLNDEASLTEYGNSSLSVMRNHSVLINIDNELEFLFRRTNLTGNNNGRGFYFWPTIQRNDLNIRYSEYFSSNVLSKTSIKKSCRLRPAFSRNAIINNDEDCCVFSSNINGDVPICILQVTKNYLGNGGIVPKRYEISTFIDPDNEMISIVSIRRIS